MSPLSLCHKHVNCKQWFFSQYIESSTEKKAIFIFWATVQIQYCCRLRYSYTKNKSYWNHRKLVFTSFGVSILARFNQSRFVRTIFLPFCTWAAFIVSLWSTTTTTDKNSVFMTNRWNPIGTFNGQVIWTGFSQCLTKTRSKPFSVCLDQLFYLNTIYREQLYESIRRRLEKHLFS